MEKSSPYGSVPTPAGLAAGSGLRQALGLPVLQPSNTSTPVGLGLLAQAMGVDPVSPETALPASALSAMATAAVSGHLWAYVTNRFKAFLNNLALTERQVDDGRTKYRGVVSCLNAAYWNTNSSTENAFLIGSWAKGTPIRPPRDVDLYFVLPRAVYERFQAYSAGANRQSALLQEVKSKLLATYPTSRIQGDGPVVIAGFDSYNVEVVPAFLYDSEDRSYYVCDTKDGGRYKTTKPLHEMDSIGAADTRNNLNVRRLVRMLKCWQAFCAVPIKSFYLELLAVDFLDQWQYKDKSYFYYDWMCRDFFAWMATKSNTYVLSPGTYETLWLGDGWKSKAQSAHSRAIKACDYEHENDMLSAGDEWQKIFGSDIPMFVS